MTTQGTEIVVQQNVVEGLEVTFVAFAQDIYGVGMKFRNTGRETIRFKQGVGARVLTIANPTKVDGLDVTDRTVNIAANKTIEIGPFPKSYNQSDGYIYLTVDAVTNSTIGVVRQ